MAQLSAIKAMFHNDAKVLERLDRIETWHVSTKHVITEIFNMLKSIDKSGCSSLHQLLTNDCKDTIPGSLDNSWAGNQKCGIFCVGDERRDGQDKYTYQENFDQSANNLVYTDSACDNVGTGATFEESASDTRRCIEDGELTGTTDISGTLGENRVDLDAIPLEDSRKCDSICIGPRIRLMPAAEQLCQGPGCSSRIKTWSDKRPSGASKNTSKDMVTGEQLETPAGGATSRRSILKVAKRLDPPLPNLSCSTIQPQTKAVLVHDEYDEVHPLPVAQTEALSCLGRSSNDTGSDKSIFAHLVHFEGSRDSA
jgi:hypothetical protein